MLQTMFSGQTPVVEHHVAPDISVIEMESWRREMLASVEQRLHRWLSAAPPAGVAEWRSVLVPLPKASAIAVFDTGLNFTINVQGHDVLFSLLLQFCEVRVGLKVPRQLLQTADAVPSARMDAVSRCYDGALCGSRKRTSTHFCLDWIWQEVGFSSFAAMHGSLTDDWLAGMIADQSAFLLKTIYLNAMEVLVAPDGEVGYF